MVLAGLMKYIQYNKTGKVPNQHATVNTVVETDRFYEAKEGSNPATLQMESLVPRQASEAGGKSL